MQVQVDLGRPDIARLNLSKLFRLKSNLKSLVFILMVVTFLAWRGAAAEGGEIDWIAVTIASLGGFAIIFVFSLLFVLLNSTAESGVIGKHTYTIEDEGLRDLTDANDTLNFWPSIKTLEKSKSAILVQINAWMFYVLPRRAFDSDEQYDAFFEALKKHTEARAS